MQDMTYEILYWYAGALPSTPAYKPQRYGDGAFSVLKKGEQRLQQVAKGWKQTPQTDTHTHTPFVAFFMLFPAVLNLFAVQKNCHRHQTR